MWLPYLERLGVPFVLVVRTIPNFRQLASATDHPVLLRRSIPDLDALIVPSARGVFYVNNAMRNNHMVRYSGQIGRASCRERVYMTAVAVASELVRVAQA